MISKLFFVGITGSAVAYFNVDYGMLIIILGMIFIIILEFWNKKPPKDSKPLYTDDPILGI